MISTIKQFSREDKHLAEFRDAKNSKLNHVSSVVFWRNTEEFVNNIKDTFSFFLVLSILLGSTNSELSGPQLITVFLM